MSVAFIVNCTANKRFPSQINFKDVKKGIIPEEWLEHINMLPEVCRAADLYKGQYWSLCMEAFATMRAKRHVSLYIVSAGLGIVSGDKRVPSYEATFSSLSVSPIRTRFNGTNAEWIAGLTDPEILEEISRDYEKIVVCTSTEYEQPVTSLLPWATFLTLKGGHHEQILYKSEWINHRKSPYRTGMIQIKGQIAKHYAENLFPDGTQSELNNIVARSGY